MKFANELKPPLEDALEHYGVLGMKWGVRKDDRGPSRSQAKQDVRKLRKAARSSIKTSRSKDSTEAQRRAAAKKYENEVYKQFRSKEFRESYTKATSVGKGEMTAHFLLFGPLALATIPYAKITREGMQKKEWSNSQRQSAKILKELNSNIEHKDNDMIELYNAEKKDAVADGYIKKDASEEEFMKVLGWDEAMFKEK